MYTFIGRLCTLAGMCRFADRSGPGGAGASAPGTAAERLIFSSMARARPPPAGTRAKKQIGAADRDGGPDRDDDATESSTAAGKGWSGGTVVDAEPAASWVGRAEYGLRTARPPTR